MFVLTSLSPRPEAERRQKEALATWKQAGFKGVSLNFPEENANIRRIYPELADVGTAYHRCLDEKGRPHVAVAELIERSFVQNKGKFSFILNADIALSPLVGQLLSKKCCGITLIPRWQMPLSGENEAPEKDPWGYDGVWLGPDLRGIFNNRAFGMGLPWWDYWIPFRGLYLGYSLRILEKPLAFHARHPKSWSEKDRARLAGQLWRETGVAPWRQFWRKHFGPKAERKYYGHYNHLAGFIRQQIAKALLLHAESSDCQKS